MALSQDAVQSMLNAMQIISSAQMQNISYDETIVCTITDNSRAKQESYYTVTDGSVRFRAYVTSTEDTTKYKVDDQVYVKIPKGDYSQQKVIEGYYVTDAEVVPVTYVSPLDTFLDMANLIETDGTTTDVSGQLIANDTTTNQIALWQWSINNSDGTSDDLQANGIYDTLGLQASFKCLLDSYKMRKGTYGLRLDLYVRLNPTSDKHITKSVYLDSTEMFGNPYSFTIYATQAKTFDITKIGTIDGMTLWFYQNKDFTYFDGKNEHNLPIADIANIFVKDIYIAFGSELSKVEDNIIKLYTTENQNFKYEQPGDATNKKHLGFLWYNKTEDSDYIGFSDGIVDLKRNTDGEVITPEEIDHYDEIEYLTLSRENSRLVEQMGKDVPDDENGLDVAASVAEAKTIFEKLTRAVQVNLVNTLSDFYQRTKSLSLETDDGVISCNEYFNKVGENDTPIGKIKIAETYGNALEEDYKQLLQWYNSALSAAAAIEKHQKDSTTPTEKKEPTKIVRYRNNKWESVTSWVDKDDKTQTNSIKTNGYASILATLQPLLNNYYTYVEIDGEMKPEFVLDELRTNISNKYNGFQDIYDTYSARVDSVLKDIQAYFEELNSILQYENESGTTLGKENLITSSNKDADKDSSSYQYTLNKTITTYTQRDFSHMENRYCVYWYRYVAGYKDEEGLIEDEWMRLKPGDAIQQTCNTESPNVNFVMPENLGLPSTWTEDGGTLYFSPKAGSGEGFASVYLNPVLKEEKFKVVLYYNHERFVSNELVFTNLDKDRIPDGTTMDATDGIYIEHDTNSMESYQTLYASNYSLTNKGHSSINRKLRLHYDGLYGKDEVLAGAAVYWYLPRNATMLTANVKRLTSAEGDRKAFSTDYYRTAKVLVNSTAVRRGPGVGYQKAQVETIKTETKDDGTTEQVKTKIDLVYKKNDIIQAVYSQRNGWYSLTASEAIGAGGQWINGADIEVIDNDEIFMDGYACFYKTIGFEKVTEGIEDEEGNVQFVEKDVIVEDDAIFEYRIKDYYESSFLNNTIFCIVKKGEYKFETSISMIFGTQGTSGTDYTIMVKPAGDQMAVKNSNICPLSIKAFNYDNEQIPIKTTASELTDGSLYKPTIKWRGPSTANIAFLDNETGPEINSAEATVNNNAYKSFSKPKGNNACGVAQISVTMYDSTYGGAKELSVLYPVPWAAGDYFIEGPTSIVYDSSGANPVYYKSDYRIFDGATNTELVGATWDIKYFMRASAGENLLTDPNPPKYMFCWETENSTKYLRTYDISGNNPVLITQATNPTLIEEVNFYASYVPQLNTINELTPCNTYISGEPNGGGYVDLNVYPVVQCFDKNGTLIWAQPIVITQNRYPNSMINHWDGEFQIDEENGTILSTMVGAGYKNSDNTYSGVLMGKVDCDNEDNASDVGLYGFHHGAQSFGLNIDGTAFFGKSGRGRILFDGNSGTISSASYQQNKTKGDAGMMIDLDDGFIEMLGTSQSDTGAYTPDGTRSKIRLDVKSPYFIINSAAGHRLMNIGSNDPFNSNTYAPAEDENPFRGKGYYFKSDDFLPSKLKAANGNTSFEGNRGAGLLFDLAGGRLEGYSFSLKGEDSSDNYYGSSINISSNPSSFLKIVYKNASYITDDLIRTVMQVGNTNYYFHSFDWVKNLYGMEIDMANNHIVAYDENNTSSIKKALIINSDADSSYPLRIGAYTNSGTPAPTAFKVKWDGSLYIGAPTTGGGDTTYPFYVTADGTIKAHKGDIGGWQVTQNGLWKGGTETSPTAYLGSSGKTLTVCGKTVANVIFKAGSGFGVTSTGALYSNSGYIGSWQIGAGSLSSGSISITASTGSGDSAVAASLSGGSGNQTWSINNDGSAHFTYGTIGGWDITQTSLKSEVQKGKTVSSIELAKSGTIYIRNDGTLNLENGSDVTMKDGGTFTMQGGTFNLTKTTSGGVTMNIQSGSTVNVEAGCSFNVKKDATLTIATGGEFVFGGGLLRIGKEYTRNGHKSYIQLDNKYVGITEDIKVKRTWHDSYYINVVYGMIVGIGEPIPDEDLPDFSGGSTGG